MQDVQTRLSRDRDGWRAESQIPLTPARLLKVTTRKVISGSGMCTTADVWRVDESGVMRHAMAFGGPNGDYSETLAFSRPARVTEAVVSAQHQAALDQLQRVLEAIERHYSKAASASDTVVATLATTTV